MHDVNLFYAILCKFFYDFSTFYYKNKMVSLGCRDILLKPVSSGLEVSDADGSREMVT